MSAMGTVKQSGRGGVEGFAIGHNTGRLAVLYLQTQVLELCARLR